MKYLVYLTICTVNKKIYVGVHKTENPDIFDGYIGCGVRINVPESYKKSETPFQYAVNKYGVKAFIRKTLRIFDTKEEAFALEKEIVTQQFIERPDTYNIKLGGEGDCPECLKQKVYMYDLDGIFIREFETTLECNKYFVPTAHTGGHVARAIKCGHLFHNYQLSYEKLPYMKKYEKKPFYNHGAKVGKYDFSNNLIEVYDCVNAAMRAGYTNVRQNLSGKTKSCKGFIFKFIYD